MARRRPAGAGPVRATRAVVAAAWAATAAACGGGEEQPPPADTTTIVIPVPQIDTTPTASLAGPWASEAWRAWRDTAASGELVDSALAELDTPRDEWSPAATWAFVAEALAERATRGDRFPARVLLAAVADTTRVDSLESEQAYAHALSAVFEAHPGHFADAFADLPPTADARAVGALLDGWLHLALEGRAPLDPPSARLAALPGSIETQRLQARLAMREAPYVKALRAALENRRGVVT